MRRSAELLQDRLWSSLLPSMFENSGNPGDNGGSGGSGGSSGGSGGSGGSSGGSGGGDTGDKPGPGEVSGRPG